MAAPDSVHAPEVRDPEDALPGPRERRAARLAFAAIALLFVLQVVLIRGGAGEPYPAVIMPGFGGSGGYRDGEVHVARMEAVLVHADGETAVSQRQLLAPYPDSHHGSIAGLFLNPAPREAPPLRRWLRRTLLPGLAAGQDRPGGRVNPSLCGWARWRAAELLPGARVRRMEIRWYRDTYRPGSRTPAAREPLGRMSLPLDGGAACGA